MLAQELGPDVRELKLRRDVDQFNDWGGGGDVTYLSPFWEGTARK